MKIKTLKDVHAAAQLILGDLVARKVVPYFNLLVDHGDGVLSNCMFSPATNITAGQNFMAVDDHEKVLVLLLKHPAVKDLEYREKDHMISGIFNCPEMLKLNELEEPYSDMEP